MDFKIWMNLFRFLMMSATDKVKKHFRASSVVQ